MWQDLPFSVQGVAVASVKGRDCCMWQSYSGEFPPTGIFHVQGCHSRAFLRPLCKFLSAKRSTGLVAQCKELFCLSSKAPPTKPFSDKKPCMSTKCLQDGTSSHPQSLLLTSTHRSAARDRPLQTDNFLHGNLAKCNHMESIRLCKLGVCYRKGNQCVALRSRESA